MFEISQLKEKKLPELQEIAKELNISKFRSLKKLDLVYKILDHQAANPTSTKPAAQEQKKNDNNKRPQRQRRERVQKPKENNQKAIEFKDKEQQFGIFYQILVDSFQSFLLL